MDPNPKDKKGFAPGDKVCANCLAPQGSASVAKLSSCTRCGLVAYCSKDCQRAHWKTNHKQFCIAKADRAPPPQATALNMPDAASVAHKEAAVRAVAAGGECAICLDPLTAASAFTLPCGHVFHAACVAEVRKFGVKQVCPVCRTELPPGPEKLHDEAGHRYMVVDRRAQQRGETSWGALTKAEQKEMNEVVRMWREAAEQGHSESQYSLGTLFHHAEGVKQDYSEAAKWFRQAADQGHAGAQCDMGTMYKEGRGVKQDNSDAAKWWRKAATQGISRARFNLGLSYSLGQGVKLDLSEAAKWFLKAANKGFVNAQNTMGSAYRDGVGVKQDYTEAAKWLRKAADQGFPEAQTSLGTMYAQGQGAKQDYSEAAKLWRKAADQESDEARFNLASCYDYGYGVQRSRFKAIELYTLTANQGDGKAKVKAKQRLAELQAYSLVGTRVQLQGLKAKPELKRD